MGKRGKQAEEKEIMGKYFMNGSVLYKIYHTMIFAYDYSTR